MSTSTSSPSETEGSTELNSGSDFLPPSPTLDSYDFGNGETVSFLADESIHTPPPPPPQPEQQHELASTSVDWNQLLSLWSDAGDWAADGADMQIDPQLVGQDGLFVDPASVSAPADVLDGALGHVMPTAQELAGLTPLLDAFPFTLDANGFPVMRQLPGDGGQAFTPNASLEQSDSSSSMAASEDELARFARNSMGVPGSLPHSQIQANVKTPPASTASGSSSNGSPKSVSPLAAAVAARPTGKATQPKSSHKEVESRYRGKVSAGILALRNAIPAVRILDESPQTPCSVNERGYVDGLRPAPNDTRATVFAKAVEYISILKARENRLRKENDGLKNLVSSLVGGQQLLDAWERSWREKYGSERDDEDRIAGEGSCSFSNENDADDEEQSRPAKKAKKASPTLDPKTGEKRKRGRPRKNPPAPAPQQQQQTPGQAQYLLASFALLSLWNNAPRSSSSPSSAGHEGVVVANVRVDDLHAASDSGFHWGHAIQAVHVLASLAVLVSIFISFTRRRWAARHTAASSAVLVASEAASSSSTLTPPELSAGMSDATSSAGPATPRVEAGADLAFIASVSSDAEDTVIPLKSRANATFRPSAQKGSFSQLASVADVLASGVGYALSTVCAPGFGCTEQDIEALVRRAEALVVEGDEAPLSQRFQTFFTLLASRPRSAAHRAALALLAHSLGMADAAAEAWAGIRPETACERVVLGRLGVEAAHDRLLELSASEHVQQESAVGRLACDWARTEAPALAREAFQCVARGGVPDPARVDELRAVGAELGDARLALAVCAAVSSLTSSSPVPDADLLDLGDAETEDVVRALLLFRRAFPAVCLTLSTAREGAGDEDEATGTHMLATPPPSPAPRDARAMLALQQVLGRAVFDAPALEDARDRIVDMVCAAGRTNRRRTAAFAF